MKTAELLAQSSLNPVAESTPEKPSEEESDSNEKPTQTLQSKMVRQLKSSKMPKVSEDQQNQYAKPKKKKDITETIKRTNYIYKSKIEGMVSTP